jgi:hypothetical protein
VLRSWSVSPRESEACKASAQYVRVDCDHVAVGPNVLRLCGARRSEEPVSQRDYSSPPVSSFQRTSVEEACDIEPSLEDFDRPQGPWHFLATVTPLSGPKHVVMSGPNALTLVQSVGHPDCTTRGCTAIAPKLPCWQPWLRLLCLLFGVLVYPSVHHSCCAVFRGLRLVCSLSSVPARVWPYRFRSPYWY